MTDQPHFLMCSACYAPTPAQQAHVVPRWNPQMQSVVTAYRCHDCWPASLDELRASICSGDEVQNGVCDFLERRGFSDVQVIRDSAPEVRQGYLLQVVDALASGRLILDP